MQLFNLKNLIILSITYFLEKIAMFEFEERVFFLVNGNRLKYLELIKLKA